MRTGLIASSVVLGAVLLLAIFRYDIAMFAASRGVGWVSGGYFDLFENTAPELSEVAPGVYWFNTTYTRSLILETDDGLVVVDPFNTHHAEKMREAIDIRWGAGKKVAALIYSHHHFDHIRGGEVLNAARIIAPDDLTWHLDDGWKIEEIAQPTDLVHGDQTLTIGGVDILLKQTGRGHAESLFAVYLPKDKILYAPDLAFVQTMPPFNLPDTNYPGLQKQIKTALELPFEKFVPSHFRISMDGRPYATRQDVEDFQRMMDDFQQWTRQAFDKYGVPVSHEAGADVFLYVRERSDDKYGDWTGYDQMSMPLALQYFSATYLGF